MKYLLILLLPIAAHALSAKQAKRIALNHRTMRTLIKEELCRQEQFRALEKLPQVYKQIKEQAFLGYFETDFLVDSDRYPVNGVKHYLEKEGYEISILSSGFYVVWSEK